MPSRRQFLRNAAALTGSTFVWGAMPEAIARALSINPKTGTTYCDADHLVILMQENRSFDHCFGSLRGVRGFRDPRVHRQSNGRPVWLQTDAAGRIHAPFRLDMRGSDSTWIGGLPHSWPDQIESRNGGRYDRWLIAKAREDLLPLTMGHYTRADLPFYYALAEAFTVCDQAFCSSLTGTTPNRLYLWSGAVRKNADSPARVLNEDTGFDTPADWTTFPERLEDAGVSWRIYQNELSVPSGLDEDEDNWLSNFTDNPLEWFPQFRVRFSKSRRAFVERRLATLANDIAAIQLAVDSGATHAGDGSNLQEGHARLLREFESMTKERETYNAGTWAALSAGAKALHQRAFTTNSDAANFRSLTELRYKDGSTNRSLKVPQGDVLHRFRHDVESGKLPTVSWLIAPEAFSDHPASAWFGAWYVSESLNILTQDPDLWRKTIFILCYDENDGYFDHVPPFVAPHPGRPETGRVSAGIDTATEIARRSGLEHPIGLGYRCPLVVASPWSRGGNVNSQVFDHTSVIQFIECWLAEKGRIVHEPNISDWRRVVCGNLTSVFRPFDGGGFGQPKPLDRDETIIGIHRARFAEPTRGKAPSAVAGVSSVDVGSAQESGTRPSCPLPYELEANGSVEEGRLHLIMEARNRRFGPRAAGAPFNLYVYGSEMSARAYAVKAGGKVEDSLEITQTCRVKLDGPNGFCREFYASARNPQIVIFVEANGAGLDIRVTNHSASTCPVDIRDHAYGAAPLGGLVAPGDSSSWRVGTGANRGWYDFSADAGALSYRYSGRVETGEWSISDPAMA